MQHKSHALITSGICLMAFPFMMIAAELIFVNTASKLGIPRHKYPRLVVSSFRFFNGHVKSTGITILLLGVLLTLFGAYQSMKEPVDANA